MKRAGPLRIPSQEKKPPGKHHVGSHTCARSEQMQQEEGQEALQENMRTLLNKTCVMSKLCDIRN